MKRPFPCAQQQRSPSNVTNYTAPATQNDIPKYEKICGKRMKLHLQCQTIENDLSMIQT